MPGLSDKLTRQLTPKQVGITLGIVLAMAALGIAAYWKLEPQRLDYQARKLLPQIEAGIRDQQEDLVKALEAYKAHFGVYPPDRGLGRAQPSADGITNALAYELGGVVYDAQHETFNLAKQEPADATFVTNFFQCAGFKNSGTNQNQVRTFLPLDNFSLAQLHDDPDIYVLRFDPRLPVADWEVLSRIELTPWRYVSSAPRHNPGRYDLWVDIWIGGKKTELGNWPPAAAPH